MEQETMNENKSRSCWWHCGCGTKAGSLGWGVFFLLLGGFFILRELGYITYSVSIWPVLLTAFGVYLLARAMLK